MDGCMPDRWPILVPAFLAAQAVLVHWAGMSERPPASPGLAQFPIQLGEWKMLREDPLDKEVTGALRADDLLSRTYVSAGGAPPASLFIAWFRTQRAGATQPHSPQVCLPGAGWIPQSTAGITLATAAGEIAVNRYIASNRGERAVILYWYQTPHRAIAGEWAAKFWLLNDAIRYRRTDTSLVRVVVWSTHTGDEAAAAAAADFVRSAYPVLRARLP
jgi:EpsI family protein